MKLMATKNYILYAMGFLGLTSCAVGPDYHAPKPAVPARYTSAAPTTQIISTEPAPNPATQPSAISTGAEPVARWWTTLQDAQLNQLIDRAVA
jgi:outer membrane protein TolC